MEEYPASQPGRPAGELHAVEFGSSASDAQARALTEPRKAEGPGLLALHRTDHVQAQLLAVMDRPQGVGRARPVTGRMRHRGSVPTGPDAVGDAQARVGAQASGVVPGEPVETGQGDGSLADRADHRGGGHPTRGTEVGGVDRHPRQPSVRQQLDSGGACLIGGVAGHPLEAWPKHRQRHRSGVGEHDASGGQSLGDRRGGFHSGQPTPGDHDGCAGCQFAESHAKGSEPVRTLQRPAVLGQTRHAVDRIATAHPDDQFVVTEVPDSLGSVDPHGAPFRIDGRHPAVHQLDARQQLGQRHPRPLRANVAGDHLGRPAVEGVIGSGRDQPHPHPADGAERDGAGHGPGGPHPGVAAAQHHDLGDHVRPPRRVRVPARPPDVRTTAGRPV